MEEDRGERNTKGATLKVLFVRHSGEYRGGDNLAWGWRRRVAEKVLVDRARIGRRMG